MIKRCFALLIFVLCTTGPLQSQCSDAGVCSIGAPHSVRQHELGIRYVYGSAGTEEGLKFSTLQAEGSFTIWNDLRASIVAPWVSITGPLGSARGMGDITLIFSAPVWSNESAGLSLHAGGKISTAAVNEADLPQAYQPGLGTNDLLFGATVQHGSMMYGVGYQLSRQRSDNRFTRLERGDDLLLRVGYGTSLGDATIRLELLGIKRLSKSTVLNRVITAREEFVSVAKSDQLQINLLGSARYPLSDDLALDLEMALPFLQRDVNIDGLKRAFSAGAGLRMFF